MKNFIIFAAVVFSVALALTAGCKGRGSDQESEQVNNMNQKKRHTDPDTPSGRQLALLIGVDEYANLNPLRCSVNDMKTLKKALLKIGFMENDIQMLVTNGSYKDFPTKKKIEKKLSDILSSTKSSDMLFIAFSGHGAQNGNKVYFCPPDTDLDDLDGTCVSITQMMDDIAKCPARFKWVVVDACRNEPNRSRSAKGLQVVPAPPAGIALFQSCAEGERSFEEERRGGNGYFTKNLAAALSGAADSNHDGRLTLFEVCAWTTDHTKSEVWKAENVTQRPYFSGSVSDFTLKEDENILTAKLLAEEARQAMKSENYALAISRFDEALELCPRFDSWKRERDSAQRLLNAKPAFNSMHITVPNNFATIAEAYQNVKNGGIITIQPGKYELTSTLTVNRPVTFRGSTGRAEDVVIDCPSTHAFKITDSSPSFQNLAISSGAEACSAFYVTGGSPKLFRCVISSRKGVGMYVEGENANPQVESCALTKCGKCGVIVSKNAQGSFNDCDVHENHHSGIVVGTSGNPTVAGCKIHDGKDAGVLINENGLGKFIDCEIYGNTFSGIEVKTSGNPTVTGCKIHDGKYPGVWINENGLGSFNNCEIYGNDNSGFMVTTSGNPTVTGCKIHDGKQNGVYVHKSGLGSFNNCEIYGNAKAGIETSTAGNPTVTGCKIHDGKNSGVYVHDKGKGTFNNNTLEKNVSNGKPDDWNIHSTADSVNGSDNTPPIPSR